MENGLTLLAQSSLPFKFWDEAFRTAVYIHNRLPTPVLGLKSPLEVLHNLRPNYSMLKTFGCASYPNIRPYKKHKLAYRIGIGLLNVFSWDIASIIKGISV